MKEYRAPDGSGNYFHLSPLDVALFLLYLHGAASMPEELGHADARHTLEDITRYLEQRTGNVKIHMMHLEKALYAANLMDEIGHFWHPKVKNFEELVGRIKSRYSHQYNYNTTYNLIERIRKENRARAHKEGYKQCFKEIKK